MRPIIEVFGIGHAAQSVSMPPNHPPMLIFYLHVIGLPAQFHACSQHFFQRLQTSEYIASHGPNNKFFHPRAVCVFFLHLNSAWAETPATNNPIPFCTPPRICNNEPNSWSAARVPTSFLISRPALV